MTEKNVTYKPMLFCYTAQQKMARTNKCFARHEFMAKFGKKMARKGASSEVVQKTFENAYEKSPNKESLPGTKPYFTGFSVKARSFLSRGKSFKVKTR